MNHNTFGEIKTFHCYRCHGEHINGTSYVCYNSPINCDKCNPKNQQHKPIEDDYKYCPHCGKHL